MSVSRRSFLVQAAALAATPYMATRIAGAATPKAMAVIGQSIDGIVNGFDPAEAYDASLDTIGNMYRTLFAADPAKPGQLAGDLAHDWTVSADGTHWTIKLRPALQFESGAPVTADDVAFSLQRVIRLNRAPSFLLGQLGLTPANIETAVRASAPDTVAITLPEARASGLVMAALSTTCASVVEKKVVLAHETNGDLGNAWLRTHSAGAGAYRLVSWQASDHIVLDTNAHAGVKPLTPRAAIRHMAEPATELLLLKRGDIDIGRTLGSDQLKTISGDTSLDVVSKDVLTLLLLQVNMAVPQFQKVQARQAIKLAIDYDAIARNITPDLWSVWQSFLPKGTPGALHARLFQKDLAKAKALMSEAGLAAGVSVTLDHPNSWPFVEIAQALQADLGQIGIRVELLAGSYAQVLAKRRARTHQMSLARFSADHLDPSSFASYYCFNPDDSADSKNKTGAWNAHFVDAKLNAAGDAAAREMNEQKRIAMYADMQKHFASVSPFMFLLQKRDVAVQRKGVQGISLGAVNAYTRFDRITKA
ncbi:ABC transporter substrate-binding protein [Trinickia sp.]|uniref:ABC transporter substrate-binding protein n=1 Tax=Trinickia sp. TaxID=2571163 RepID=UPI003F82079E